MFWCGVTICSIMLFNFYGLILTQKVSATFRAIWDAMRTILVWVSLYHNSKATSLGFGLESFILIPFLIQGGGFVFLLLGNFIYNEIIEVPGFTKSLRKNMPHTGSGDVRRSFHSETGKADFYYESLRPELEEDEDK